MIESTFDNANETPTKTYPWIGRHPETGSIVLFCKEDSGVSLYEREKWAKSRVGKYDELWNEESFDLFNEPITLKNKGVIG